AASLRVTEATQSIGGVADENTAATHQMAQRSAAVSGSIGSIAAVAEEQSAAAEEVSASAEEMSAQIEHLTSQTQDLAATAADLRELVARFRLASAEDDDTQSALRLLAA